MKRVDVLRQHLLTHLGAVAIAKRVEPGSYFVVNMWPELKPIDGDEILMPPEMPTTTSFSYRQVRYVLARLVLEGAIE